MFYNDTIGDHLFFYVFCLFVCFFSKIFMHIHCYIIQGTRAGGTGVEYGGLIPVNFANRYLHIQSGWNCLTEYTCITRKQSVCVVARELQLAVLLFENHSHFRLEHESKT